MLANSRWLFLALALFGCSVPVASGLEEGQANQALVALEKNGVLGSKERDPDVDGRFRISVGRDDASSAFSVLAQENVPQSPPPGVLETLAQGSLVPSRMAEHAKFITGVSGELERSLRGIEGVISARVHLAVTAKDGLDPEQKPEPPSASVLIRHRGATPPIGQLAVQQLVAGAITGLRPDQVAVVTAPVPANTRTGDNDLARLGPITVTHNSVGALRLVIGGSIVLNVVFVIAILLLLVRLRKLDAALDEAQGRR